MTSSLFEENERNKLLSNLPHALGNGATQSVDYSIHKEYVQYHLAEQTGLMDL